MSQEYANPRTFDLPSPRSFPTSVALSSSGSNRNQTSLMDNVSRRRCVADFVASPSDKSLVPRVELDANGVAAESLRDIRVVPLPANGSRTTLGTGSASRHEQVGRQLSRSRCQGAPQCRQQPRWLVAARMQGSTKAAGNVAKWAPR